MKRILVIIVIIIMVALCGCHATQGKEYAQMTVVVDVDMHNDIVTCKDFNGMLWQFYGCDDWAIGDIATMIMNDNGTQLIFDDTIVSVRYDGWIDGWY